MRTQARKRSLPFRTPLRCSVALLAGVFMWCFVAPIARADFGVVPGTFFAKTHRPAPMIGACTDAGNCLIDVAAIKVAEFVTQAGAHPDATTYMELNQSDAIGTLRDVKVQTPAGFLGDPLAVPPCDRLAFGQSVLDKPNGCSPASQVGIVSTRSPGTGNHFSYPVYLLTPSPGQPATLGFPYRGFAILLEPKVRSGGDYGLTVSAKQIISLFLLQSVAVTLWGVPADPVHNPDRWNPEAQTWGISIPLTVKPFISTPTWCGSGPLSTALQVRSWKQPDLLLPEDRFDPDYLSQSPEPTGCGKLDFGGGTAPVSLTMQPELPSADTPTGYQTRLTLPFNQDPHGLASPTLRDTSVTLPEGVVVNPSSANGLVACTNAQIGFIGGGFPEPRPLRFTDEPAHCPDASKLGTVEITTPLLDHKLEGSVYLAAQHDNPFQSNLAIYIAVDDPQTGIVAKLAGEVRTDPATGRITATFTDNPQLPFTELELDFFGGPGASLLNPATCGTKVTTSVLTPWSAPYTPPVTSSDSFQITRGAGGSACAGSESQLPNRPAFAAGTENPAAAAYSPFVLHLHREDGSQRLARLDLTLPPGLTGKLANVPYCRDADLAAAARTSGVVERGSPSCPAASRIGTVNVAAGAGPSPFWAQGAAFLAGPYRGAPLSVAIVTPAVAGPFDLGTVVVRTALYVNPETAQIHAVSDPIPYILDVGGDGFPLDVRSVNLIFDRPDFTLNPTNCDEMAFAGSASSIFDQSAPLAARFQALGCRGLDFDPKLALKVFGKTNRNAKPRFRAVLQTKPGEANIARAQVNLPHSEFLEQNHIKTICTRVQFAAGDGNGSACPKGSIYGRAKAFTPLLDKPLEGPVFLRANGGERELPDLVAALDGQVNIALWGKVDSGSNEGLRNTFEVVPDAPVSKFILEMKGGKQGLLVNSENLCSPKASTRALVRFAAQNGMVKSFKPKVANQCEVRRSSRTQKGAPGSNLPSHRFLPGAAK